MHPYIIYNVINIVIIYLKFNFSHKKNQSSIGKNYISRNFLRNTLKYVKNKIIY